MTAGAAQLFSVAPMPPSGQAFASPAAMIADGPKRQNHTVSSWTLTDLPPDALESTLLNLTIPEILSFRLVSRSCLQALSIVQSSLVQNCVRKKLPRRMASLYLTPERKAYDVQFLCEVANKFACMSRHLMDRLNASLRRELGNRWSREYYGITLEDTLVLMKNSNLFRLGETPAFMTALYIFERRRDNWLRKHLEKWSRRTGNSIQIPARLIAAKGWRDCKYDPRDMDLLNDKIHPRFTHAVQILPNEVMSISRNYWPCRAIVDSSESLERGRMFNPKRATPLWTSSEWWQRLLFGPFGPVQGIPDGAWPLRRNQPTLKTFREFLLENRQPKSSVDCNEYPNWTSVAEKIRRDYGVDASGRATRNANGEPCELTPARIGDRTLDPWWWDYELAGEWY